MALFAILMCVNFTSCSKEDEKLEDEVVDEDYKVDLSGLTITDLKIDGKTYWRDEKVGGVYFIDWADEPYIDIAFSGKTEEIEYAELYLTEPGCLSQQEFLNTNKDIAKYFYLQISEFSSDYNWVYYEYWNGRASIRENNGVVIVNFNNVLFKNAATGNTKTLNGYISYRI